MVSSLEAMLLTTRMAQEVRNMMGYQQTGIRRVFLKDTGVLLWEDFFFFFWSINQCCFCYPPPPDLRRWFSFRFARLVIDAQWRVGEGPRVREPEERGSRRIDRVWKRERGRQEGGDGSAPRGLGYSLLPSADSAHTTVFGCKMHKTPRTRLVAVTELR